MGFGFGVASVVVISQAWASHKYAFLKYFAISFGLGLVHLAFIRLPLLIALPYNQGFEARYISIVSFLPFVALLFFLLTVYRLAEAEPFKKYRWLFYAFFGMIAVHKIFVAIAEERAGAAINVSWIYYNIFVALQVLGCLVMMHSARSFQARKKKVIFWFGIYYIGNIVISQALNYLSKYELVNDDMFNLVYFSFSLVIDAAPLVFLKPFLRHYEGDGVIAVGEDGISDALVDRYSISPREREIIKLICTGKTNKEIGDVLFISHQTVKDHVYKIFKKTRVKNRICLVNLVRNSSGGK